MLPDSGKAYGIRFHRVNMPVCIKDFHSRGRRNIFVHEQIKIHDTCENDKK